MPGTGANTVVNTMPVIDPSFSSDPKNMLRIMIIVIMVMAMAMGSMVITADMKTAESELRDCATQRS